MYKDYPCSIFMSPKEYATFKDYALKNGFIDSEGNGSLNDSLIGSLDRSDQKVMLTYFDKVIYGGDYHVVRLLCAKPTVKNDSLKLKCLEGLVEKFRQQSSEVKNG